MFLSKVFTSNQDLRYRNVAESDIDCIFKEMLARASVTSYEIKAKCKRILERVSFIDPATNLTNSTRKWECSPDWAAVGRILHRPDVTTSGRTLRPYIPRTVRFLQACKVTRHLFKHRPNTLRPRSHFWFNACQNARGKSWCAWAKPSACIFHQESTAQP